MARANPRQTVLTPAVIVLALAASGMLSIPAHGQPRRPDFSGRWMNPVPAGEPGADVRGRSGTRGSGWGREFTIEQDDGVLVVTRVLFTRGDLQPPIKLRFALDGSPTVNTILMGRGVERQTSTAAWDGDALVITTRYDVPAGEDGAVVTLEEARRLSLQPPPAGRNAWPPSLALEVVRKGVLGGPSSTTRMVFSRDY
jgi:hypothetical protein